MVDAHTITVVTKTCTVHFNDPMLALAWMRVVAGQFAPEMYVALQKALHPMNSDLVRNVQNMVNVCFGAST